jgi:uncharacterized protein (DUF2147 family)
MKIKKILLVLLLISGSALHAQTVFGKWKTINEDTGKPNSIIEIFEEDGEVKGKVIRILKESDRKRLCTLCEGDLKNKPIEGLELMHGMKKDGKEYSGGVITDPKSGKKYKVKIWVEEHNPDRLKVRGYIAFFYRTETWERVK